MLPVFNNVHCIDELTCMSSQNFTPPSFLIVHVFSSLFCLLKQVECLLKLVFLYCLENQNEIGGGIRFLHLFSHKSNCFNTNF